MTPDQIEETLKLLQLEHFIQKTETQQLPSVLLENEEVCFAFTTYEVKPARTPTTSAYKIHWIGYPIKNNTAQERWFVYQNKDYSNR